MKFKLTISRATKTPTPAEELLKLYLLEQCKNDKALFEMHDEVLLLLRKRDMLKSHTATVQEAGNCIVVSRRFCNSTVLKLEPIV